MNRRSQLGILFLGRCPGIETLIRPDSINCCGTFGRRRPSTRPCAIPTAVRLNNKPTALISSQRLGAAAPKPPAENSQINAQEAVEPMITQSVIGPSCCYYWVLLTIRCCRAVVAHRFKKRKTKSPTASSGGCLLMTVAPHAQSCTIQCLYAHVEAVAELFAGRRVLKMPKIDSTNNIWTRSVQKKKKK